MLADIFPGRCSRLKIFLCHAHADRAVAEEIAQALKNDGHVVFFDKDSLPPAGDYNEQILKAIEASDRFIFLISRNALAEGKFTLSELAFARERFPNAEGAVFPILIDTGVPMTDVPAYLRSVHILQVEGNAPVEVLAAIRKSRKVSGACIAGLLGVIAAAGVAGLVVMNEARVLLPATDFALLKPQQVDFRPMKRPAGGREWLNSDVAVSLIPVQYANRSGRVVRVLNEKVEVKMAGNVWPYDWFNEVTITPAGCATDWLCTKSGIGADKVEPGETRTRETMFTLKSGGSLKWSAFLDKIFDPAVKDLEVVLTSHAESTVLSQSQTSTKEIVCRVDVEAARAGLIADGFKPGAAPYPPRVSPVCLP